MKPITKKQAAVLNYILTFIKLHGHSPTMDNIALDLSKARSTVHEQVDILVKYNYLIRVKGRVQVEQPTLKTIDAALFAEMVSALQFIKLKASPYAQSGCILHDINSRVSKVLPKAERAY